MSPAAWVWWRRLRYVLLAAVLAVVAARLGRRRGPSPAAVRRLEDAVQRAGADLAHAKAEAAKQEALREHEKQTRRPRPDRLHDELADAARRRFGQSAGDGSRRGRD